MFPARGWHACVGPETHVQLFSSWRPFSDERGLLLDGRFGDTQAGQGSPRECHAMHALPPRPLCKVVGVVHRSPARYRSALLLAAADAAAALLLYKKNTKELEKARKKKMSNIVVDGLIDAIGGSVDLQTVCICAPSQASEGRANEPAVLCGATFWFGLTRF